MTCNGVRFETTKAHKLPDGSLFASCGEVENNVAVRQWLSGSGDKPILSKDDSFDGILIKPDGTAWMLNKNLHPVAIESQCFATGSGRDFALLAMHLGKTAREAVDLAAEMDVWTGMGVTELHIEKLA